MVADNYSNQAISLIDPEGDSRSLNECNGELRQLTEWYHLWIAEVEAMRRIGVASRVGFVFLGTLITCAFALALCGTEVVDLTDLLYQVEF
jgi:hypothetical protein